MIAYLTGVVREVRENSAVVVAGGVGYEVQCPAGTLAKLVVGETAELNTRFIVREDAQLLFGFGDTDSVRLFDLLTGVSGVGPKLGLALLSAMPVSALAQGLLSGDAKLLSSVSGVGKKTAERLVLELQGKVPEHLAAPTVGGVRADESGDDGGPRRGGRAAGPGVPRGRGARCGGRTARRRAGTERRRPDPQGSGPPAMRTIRP